VLTPLWNHVSDHSLLYYNPQQIVTAVRIASQDCLMLQSIRDLKNKQKENESLIKRISELTHSNQKSIHDEIRLVEEKIYELQTQQDEVRQKLKDIQYTKNVYEVLQGIESSIKLSSSDLQDSAISHTANEIIKEIDTQLSLSKVTLLEIEREISKQNMIESNVARIEAQLEEVCEHVKVLTILTDELSPKNGYIAKTISNYLNIIITRLNSIIAGVWDYKMILKPINIGEDALNYKFRVEVEDKLPIPDINVVSKGMQEMINLAMKITLYKLLGLEYYPIYLDEYGDKLDKHHKSKITDIIFKMIGSSTYSQIFLISHIDMAYAQFKDTEVLEM
jgi:DNA repair exonuclease SbcCD ATPase subunit